MPTPPHRDDNLGFWRGQVTSRLDTMDDSVKRLEASLEVVKRELVESNMKIARYVGAVGVLHGTADHAGALFDQGPLWSEAMMWTLTYVLMGINAAGGALLLYLLKNGHRPHLAGIRWLLRILACIPLAGVVLNLIHASGAVPLAVLSPIRICIGYTMIGASIWGFVWWLVRGKKETNYDRTH